MFPEQAISTQDTSSRRQIRSIEEFLERVINLDNFLVDSFALVSELGEDKNSLDRMLNELFKLKKRCKEVSNFNFDIPEQVDLCAIIYMINIYCKAVELSYLLKYHMKKTIPPKLDNLLRDCKSLISDKINDYSILYLGVNNAEVIDVENELETNLEKLNIPTIALNTREQMMHRIYREFDIKIPEARERKFRSSLNTFYESIMNVDISKFIHPEIPPEMPDDEKGFWIQLNRNRR